MAGTRDVRPQQLPCPPAAGKTARMRRGSGQLPAMNLALHRPTTDLRDSYLDALRELLAEGRHGDVDPGERAGSFDGFVARLHAWSEGRDLREGWVPFTESWITA